MNRSYLKQALLYISFGSLAVICAAMVIISLVYREPAANDAASNAYGSVWFSLLWLLFAVSGAAYFIMRKAYRNLTAAFIHIALLLIITGALVSRLTAKAGTLHLRSEQTAEAFIVNGSDEETVFKMPFTVKLTELKIVRRPYTVTPKDYVCTLDVADSDGSHPAVVSMNNILRKGGVRIFLADYDQDLQGATFMASYDPWGTAITYTGYALLLLGLILWLWHRRGNEHQTTATHPTPHQSHSNASVLKMLCCVMLTAMPLSAMASAPTLPRTQAAQAGKLFMPYNGRIAPVETFATDIVRKLTDGKTSYKKLSAMQVVTGLMLFHQDWEGENIISVKSKKLREYLGLQRHDSYANISAMLAVRSPNELYDAAGPKAVRELIEKMSIVEAIGRTNVLKIFPCEEEGHIVWRGENDELPAGVAPDDTMLIRRTAKQIYACLLMNDNKSMSEAIGKVSSYQKRVAGKELPSALQTWCEHVLCVTPLTKGLAVVSLLAGLIALAVAAIQKNNNVLVSNVLTATSIVTCAGIAAIILMRGFVAQRMPLANGYDTLLFMSLLIQITALVLRRRSNMIIALGLLASGFMLFAATLQTSGMEIAPLQPVLASPLLGLHVSVIMLAYALLCLASFSSIGAIAAQIIRGKESATAQQLTSASKAILPLALTALAAGIILGSIWANISWGSYWSWDNKEVWSLITFIAYSFNVHEKCFKRLKKPMFYNVCMAAALVALAMTYFGVNILLPGLHSYSGM